MDCSTPGLPVHHQLPEFTQTHVHWIGDAIQPSHPLSSPSPPFNCSQHQGLFKWVSLHIRWPKYWSFSFNISASNEYSGLISFRLNWLHLLAVQGTLKSLLQHHSSKASILWCSAFFLVQLSHPYMTAGKTIALSRQTFAIKVMSLLFNMLSGLVVVFLPKEQKSFNFMAAVTICSDLGAQENKVWHCFHCFPIYWPWSDGTRCHDLSFFNVEFWASFYICALCTYYLLLFSHSVVSESSVILWTALQALLSMEFSRQEYLSGLPFLSPGYLPNPGIKLTSLALVKWVLYHWATWEASKLSSNSTF